MQLLHTAHVPAGDGPFPLVLAVHGWGASAHDLIGLAPILHHGEALVLCPQGPLALQIAPGVLGYGWFPIAAGRPPDPAEFARGADALSAFLDEAIERHPVDRHRVVLLGFSQGGVLGYELFLRDPARFAGLAALSSWLPPELARQHLPTPEHKGRPVLVVHGSEDPMIPVDRARQSRDALLPYQVDLAYREFGMGHEVNPDALRTVVEWLEDRVLNLIQLA
jgi:phospholipase/carboxylesterase